MFGNQEKKNVFFKSIFQDESEMCDVIWKVILLI